MNEGVGICLLMVYCDVELQKEHSSIVFFFFLKTRLLAEVKTAGTRHAVHSARTDALERGMRDPEQKNNRASVRTDDWRNNGDLPNLSIGVTVAWSEE